MEFIREMKLFFINSNESYVFSDCRKLERDFKEVNSQLMIDQCLDLGVWCNHVINSSGRWSMARLVVHLVSDKLIENSTRIHFDIREFSFQCKLQVNKDPKVRMSKWHIQPLTKEQQIYAAIDVFVSMTILYLK